MKKIELGDVVKDQVSGFAGVAVGRVTWLSGVDQISVRPISKIPNMMSDSVFIDELQLIHTGAKSIKLDVSPTIRQINHGDKVRDVVSSAEGIVVGCVEWISGCHTIYLQMGKIDKTTNKLNELIGFDESRLEIITKAYVKLPERKQTGGPAPRY